MRKIFLVLLWGLFMMAPQQSEAQFLKKLGKIAESVGKDMWDGITNGPFQVAAEKGTCTIADVTCSLQTAARKETDLYLAVTVQNDKDDDVTIDFSNVKVIDAEGNSYNCVLSPKSNMELISGVPIKVTIIAKGVAQNIRSLTLVRLGTAEKGKAEWRNVTF